jgi:transcriptional regulator GlxA family with amidase domain
MRKRFSEVDWQSERSCIFNPRTATASGVSGYLPLAQMLIERRVSADVFRDIAQLMVLPHPAARHPAFRQTSLIEQPSLLLRQLHELIHATPAHRLTVAEMAARANMSERTLARKIGGEAGQSVAAYARRIKLNQVSDRLILTSLPVTRIAEELGFSSESNLRRMFKELTGLTPADYRRQYGRA